MNVQERWDAKLTNWALWIVGQSKSSPTACDGEFGEGAPRPPPPLVGEALDTDRLLQRLLAESREQYDAVDAWYVWSGSQQERAERLNVPYTTWRERVIAARFRLEELAILRRAAVAPVLRAFAFA